MSGSDRYGWADDAPCGYLVITEVFDVERVNRTLLGWLDYREDAVAGKPLANLLTKPGRILLQLYFLPMIRMSGKVEEMYLSLLTRSGEEIPVLLYASSKGNGSAGPCTCILLPMRRRPEYEHTILETEQRAEQAKRELEELERQVASKRLELDRLDRSVEARQRELMRRAIGDNLAETEALLMDRANKDDG